jgi:uncharacterized protein (TIGR00297 family)
VLESLSFTDRTAFVAVRSNPSTAAPPNENLRQLEHLLPIGFAFLMRYLTWPQAIGMAVAATLYGAFSSRIWPRTRRAGEAAGAPSPGKVWYGLAVLVLILLFPGQQFIVVAAWANLSVGDSVSNLIGRNFGLKRLPWNLSKTWLGSASGFLSSTAAAFVLIMWTGLPGGSPCPPGLAFWLAAATSLVCSAVETVPLPIDDNLAICLTGGAFLSWLAQAVPPAFDPRLLGQGLLVSAALGGGALIIRGVSGAGFVSGVVLGTAVFYAFSAPGFVLLAAFFVLGTAFTKLGYRRKAGMGAAQADGSRRSPRHVWGKGIAALLAAVAAVFLKDASLARLGFVAAMAASLADTTATELGLLAGRRPLLLSTFTRVPPGTPGAITLEGSGFGLLAALMMSFAGYGLGLVSGPGAAFSAFAAVMSTHLESWLRARQGTTGASGPVMNAFHTVTAMLSAVLLGRYFG